MATKAVGGYLSLARLATRFGYLRTGKDIEVVLAQYFPADAEPRVEADGVVSTGSQQKGELSLDGLPQERGYRAFGPTSTLIGVGDSMVIDGALRVRYRRGSHLELKPFDRQEVFINDTKTPALPSDRFTSFKVGDKIYIGNHEIIMILDIIICLDKMKGPLPRLARGVSRIPRCALATFVLPVMFFGILLYQGRLQFHPTFDLGFVAMQFALLIMFWLFVVVAL